jgi:hypothetical protein
VSAIPMGMSQRRQPGGGGGAGAAGRSAGGPERAWAVIGGPQLGDGTPRR